MAEGIRGTSNAERGTAGIRSSGSNSAGRYVEIVVRTAVLPLTIDLTGFRETRYPLEMQRSFAASAPRFSRVAPILVRGCGCVFTRPTWIAPVTSS